MYFVLSYTSTTRIYTYWHTLSLTCALPIASAAGAPERTDEAVRMDGTGAPGRGLTAASFAGEVEYREAQAEGARVARSSTLDVALTGDRKSTRLNSSH